MKWKSMFPAPTRRLLCCLPRRPPARLHAFGWLEALLRLGAPRGAGPGAQLQVRPGAPCARRRHDAQAVHAHATYITVQIRRSVLHVSGVLDLEIRGTNLARATKGGGGGGSIPGKPVPGKQPSIWKIGIGSTTMCAILRCCNAPH
eukprot:SAG22_NODE_9497_length_584_cov_1.782341_1_plen_146_part_10